MANLSNQEDPAIEARNTGAAETELVQDINTTNEIATEISEGVKLEEAKDAAEEKYAKSGKKSKKHIEEVKAEEERQARKAEIKALEEAGDKPKGATPVTRPKIERRGKNYQEKAKLVEKGKVYSLEEALKLAKDTNPAKFDATVEAHVRLGVDPRQADRKSVV